MKLNTKNICLLLIPVLAVQVYLLINLKFTAWPEMTLWPFLITKGWLPYRDIAIAHTPLMLTVLAAFYKLFGVGILQLKIFTWVLILGLDVLVYSIAKKLWSSKTAVFAVCALVVWQLFFDGNGLWFDLFMGVFALTSYYFINKKNYLWAGIFWALAFISKQTVVFFLIPIGCQLAVDCNILRQPLKGNPYKILAKFLIGAFSVFVVFIVSLLTLHLLPSFWNWAIKFGIFILPRSEGQVQLPDLKSLVVSLFPFTIFLPLIWKGFKKNINLLLWAVAGAIGAYPRFEYFHFQPAVPFLALATGIFFTDKLWKNKLINLFLVFYVLGSLYLFGGFFMRDFGETTRFYEQDVVDVVSYVDSNTNPSDRIFVMNWWDSIYSLSDRLPATDPWIPQLSWYTEIPGVQDKMVQDLTTSKPKLIVLYPYSEYGLSAYIPKKVYNYVQENYKLKEKVDDIEILIRK